MTNPLLGFNVYTRLLNELFPLSEETVADLESKVNPTEKATAKPRLQRMMLSINHPRYHEVGEAYELVAKCPHSWKECSKSWLHCELCGFSECGLKYP